MQQIAIRLPAAIIEDVDAIIGDRHGEGARCSVIRELLREALKARKGDVILAKPLPESGG